MTGKERMIADLQVLISDIESGKFHQDAPGAKTRKGMIAFCEELYKLNQCAVNGIYDNP